MDLLEIIIDRLQKIQRETEASKWLNELPIYKCPFCGKETVFKSGCIGCQEDEDEL
jgi:hypothetical protein